MRSFMCVVLLLSACSLPEPESTPVLTTNDASPELINADPELASSFPDTIGGEPFPVETYRDERALGAMGVHDAFLESLGANIGDVSVAIGHRPMATEESVHLSAYAYRVAGGSEAALIDYFIPIAEKQSENNQFAPTSVAGKEVWRAVEPSAAVAGNMLYVHGETAYLLYSNQREAAEELLAALPGRAIVISQSPLVGGDDLRALLRER